MFSERSTMSIFYFIKEVIQTTYLALTTHLQHLLRLKIKYYYFLHTSYVLNYYLLCNVYYVRSTIYDLLINTYYLVYSIYYSIFTTTISGYCLLLLWDGSNMHVLLSNKNARSTSSLSQT